MIEYHAEAMQGYLYLSGNLQVQAAAELYRTLGEALSGNRQVVVDATNVDQLHTACAQILLAARTRWGDQLKIQWGADNEAASWLAEAGLLVANPG